MSYQIDRCGDVRFDHLDEVICQTSPLWTYSFFLSPSIMYSWYVFHTVKMTEDEMVGWHHQLNEPEFEQTLGAGEGQGRLACCGPWGCRESDTTEQLNNKYCVL